jgi:hypothetical protein
MDGTRGKVAAVKRVVIVLLVLLLLFVTLPVGMEMSSMTDCPACPPTSPMTVLALCLAVLGAVVTLAGTLSGRRICAESLQMPRFLLGRRIERPPRLV